MNEIFYCVHYLKQSYLHLKTTMSSALVFSAFTLLLHSVQCTVFPPPSNPPPIPGRFSSQQFFVQDDLQANVPQTVIKEDGFYSVASEPKPDDQWFVSENESATGDFPTSTETFDRLYANGLPAIGPVATPAPDDNFIAQSSGTSKTFPDNSNAAAPGIWVLTKGPNDQYIPERWMQVQVPAEKGSDFVDADISPKVFSETVKTSGPPLFPVKSQSPPVDPSTVLQNVWVRVPAPVPLQKGFPNAATAVEAVSSVKQIIDLPQSSIKQGIQPQLIKEYQPLPALPPPPPPVVQKKSSGFAIPPPPPPPMKSVDLINSKQMVVVNPPTVPVVDKGELLVGKNTPLPQMRHIWIPMSPQTGKFITVPSGAMINVGPVPSKGIPVNSVPPVSVSDTWVLKQDGPLPRFVPQAPLTQKGNIVLAETPVVPYNSPQNIPAIGKTITAQIPGDIWPQRQDAFDGKTLTKVGSVDPSIPLPVKSDSVLGKSVPVSPPQKMFSYGKIMPPPMVKSMPVLPPPAPLAPVAIKGKNPCPILPQKSAFSPKALPYPAYRPVSTFKRSPFARIVRVNRYPYGSYYMLNTNVAPNIYTYPRQPNFVQSKNGLVRLVSANPVPFPLQRRQVAISVPVRQAALPFTAGKSIPRFLYPSAPSASRIRYALPWGGYLSALPAPIKTVAPPITKQRKPKVESSSSSSSSESSSESKSSESSSEESKKSEETAESIGSSESVEPAKPQIELETAESIESKSVSEVDTEAAESETMKSTEASDQSTAEQTIA